MFKKEFTAKEIAFYILSLGLTQLSYASEQLEQLERKKVFTQQDLIDAAKGGNLDEQDLIDVVKGGNLDEMNEILSDFVKRKTPISQDTINTIFLVLAENNHFNMMEFIINQHKNGLPIPDKEHVTEAFYAAGENNNLDMMRFITDQHKNDLPPPAAYVVDLLFYKAAENSRFDTMQCIIDQHKNGLPLPDVSEESLIALDEMEESKLFDVMKFIIGQHKNGLPLPEYGIVAGLFHKAASKNDFNMMKFIIDHQHKNGLPIPDASWSLYGAAKDNNLAMMRFIIDQHKNGLSFQAKALIYSAFEITSQYNNLDMMRFMIFSELFVLVHEDHQIDGNRYIDEYLNKPTTTEQQRAQIQSAVTARRNFDALLANPAPDADPQHVLNARIMNLTPNERATTITPSFIQLCNQRYPLPENENEWLSLARTGDIETIELAMHLGIFPTQKTLNKMLIEAATAGQARIAEVLTRPAEFHPTALHPHDTYTHHPITQMLMDQNLNVSQHAITQAFGLALNEGLIIKKRKGDYSKFSNVLDALQPSLNPKEKKDKGNKDFRMIGKSLEVRS